MSTLLRKLENKPRSYIVYGLPQRDNDPGDLILRRKVNFIDRKTKWLILDFDEIIPPSWTPDTPVKDTFNQLWSELSKAPGIDDMPPTVWQLSNSWGNSSNESPKVHAFAELDNPVEVRKLRAWADMVREDHGLNLDKAIYQRTQPIYTASPKLIGGQKAAELNDLQRVYTKKIGQPVIASEIVMNLKGMRDAQIPAEREGDDELFEYVRHRLEEEGLIYQAREDNKYDVVCPLESSHSTGKDNHTSTTIWAPGRGKGPSFHCQHTNSHSRGRNGWKWYIQELCDQGILSQKEIHKIYQLSAKADFELDEKHKSNWTVDEIQSNYIYLESTGQVYSISSETKLDISAFSNIHSRVWGSPEDKHQGVKPLKGAPALFLSNSKHEGCKIVVRERWDPSNTSLITRDGKIDCLNTWRGFSVQPVAGNTKPFHRHISFICPDPREAEALTDFIAHMIQRPWERPTWAPVHVSIIQGLGRGLLHSLICSIVSPYSTTPSPRDLFESPYNEYLYNALWVGVEETSTKSAAGVSPRLKELITAHTADINPKYGKKLTQYPVFARMFFMTNELNALPIEESDRRFWVCGPSEPGYQPKNPGYYDKFVHWIEQKENQSAVLHDMLHRDISKFNPGRIPFKTKLKEIMRSASRNPEEKALYFIRSSKQFPPFAPAAVIKNWIETYLDYHHMQPSEPDLTAIMATLPTLCGGKQYRINNKMHRMRVIKHPIKTNKLKIPEVKGIWLNYLENEDNLSWE